MLISRNLCDITLKVKGKEFRAHRNILAARSPVFMAMMTHNTQEKNTGIITIEDVDPNLFTDFLNYLYAGKTENLNSDNVRTLYVTADKYQVDELKHYCLKYMVNNITVGNFCEIYNLSLRYDEKELANAAVRFFSDKSLEILLTTKWQNFLSENLTTGNELLIKSLKLKKINN